MARLFFAAFPDATLQQRIAALTAGLAIEGKLVPTESYHLTFAFLGEVPAARVALVRAIGGALRGAPFALCFDRLESWRDSRVLALRARDSPAALERLRARLIEALVQHDFTVDTARFQPHVTLARKVTQAAVPEGSPPLDWRVRSVELVESNTSGESSRYTVLDTWPLLDESG